MTTCFACGRPNAIWRAWHESKGQWQDLCHRCRWHADEAPARTSVAVKRCSRVHTAAHGDIRRFAWERHR